MKCVLSVIWLVFAILFFVLGRWHWKQSGKVITPFKVTLFDPQGKDLPITYKPAGSKDKERVPLDKPLKDFADDFNKYLDEQNQSNRRVNRLAACGYFLAALTAFVSMVVVIASLYLQ